MITGAFQNQAQETGKAAGSSFSAELGKRVEANQGTMDQAWQVSSLNKSGLGLQALNTANKGLVSGMDGTITGIKNQNAGYFVNFEFTNAPPTSKQVNLIKE